MTSYLIYRATLGPQKFVTDPDEVVTILVEVDPDAIDPLADWHFLDGAIIGTPRLELLGALNLTRLFVAEDRIGNDIVVDDHGMWVAP